MDLVQFRNLAISDVLEDILLWDGEEEVIRRNLSVGKFIDACVLSVACIYGYVMCASLNQSEVDAVLAIGIFFCLVNYNTMTKPLKI